MPKKTQKQKLFHQNKDQRSMDTIKLNKQYKSIKENYKHKIAYEY